MGMAASQARLLTITARLADNELRSQTINNAKMRLASQSSQVSENYINALNDATMKFSNYDASGNEQVQNLTYNALTAYSSYNTQYGLVNSSGQILVSETEADLFQKSNGNLNAYLKSHGLEYTTTYFDELGDLTNDAYPAPFNNIAADDMKIYYEEYNSYENSIEVENYENNYSTYMNAHEKLANAAKDTLKSYLTYSGNSPKLSIDATTKEASLQMNSSTPQSLLTELKNAFMGTNNNTYNINNLKNFNGSSIISDTMYDEIVNELNSYSNWSGILPGSGNIYPSTGIIYNSKSDLEVSSDSLTYTVDGLTITVNEEGKVTGITGAETVTEDGTTYTYTVPAADGTLTFEQFINGLSYKATNDDSSARYFQYSVSKDASGAIDGVNVGAILTTAEDVKEEFNNFADDIINFIQTGANYEVFADWVIDQASIGADLSKYGINPNAEVGTTGDTLQDYLDEYMDAKDSFLENIVSKNDVVLSTGLSSKDTVDEDLRSSYTFTNDLGETVVVTAENLTDIDFVLQYIKHRGLTQSESFNTVIKEFLVDKMIEIYGEPKYAWVDENDTSNTDNADAKAQWYTNLFNRMLKGYKVLENGLASSSEWIEYALENGIVSLEQVDKSYNWDGLDYKTCTKITEETSNDAVTKAEAEYNRAMNDIEAKDNIYDVELKNIDTEHSSLQTEYESIKSVISKNIERTFKFNQSA